MDNKIHDQLNTLILLLTESIRANNSQPTITEWIPLPVCMIFFDYGPTQMSALIKSADLEVAQVGRRKFISKESLLDFLERKTIS